MLYELKKELKSFYCKKEYNEEEGFQIKKSMKVFNILNSKSVSKIIFSDDLEDILKNKNEMEEFFLKELSLPIIVNNNVIKYLKDNMRKYRKFTHYSFYHVEEHLNEIFGNDDNKYKITTKENIFFVNNVGFKNELLTDLYGLIKADIWFEDFLKKEIFNYEKNSNLFFKYQTTQSVLGYLVAELVYLYSLLYLNENDYFILCKKDIEDVFIGVITEEEKKKALEKLYGDNIIFIKIQKSLWMVFSKVKDVKIKAETIFGIKMLLVNIDVFYQIIKTNKEDFEIVLDEEDMIKKLNISFEELLYMDIKYNLFEYFKNYLKEKDINIYDNENDFERCEFGFEFNKKNINKVVWDDYAKFIDEECLGEYDMRVYLFDKDCCDEELLNECWNNIIENFWDYEIEEYIEYIRDKLFEYNPHLSDYYSFIIDIYKGKTWRLFVSDKEYEEVELSIFTPNQRGSEYFYIKENVKINLPKEFHKIFENIVEGVRKNIYYEYIRRKIVEKEIDIEEYENVIENIFHNNINKEKNLDNIVDLIIEKIEEKTKEVPS